MFLSAVAEIIGRTVVNTALCFRSTINVSRKLISRRKKSELVRILWN